MKNSIDGLRNRPQPWVLMKKHVQIGLIVTLGLTIGVLNNTIDNLEAKINEHEEAFGAVVEIMLTHKALIEALIEHQQNNFL